MLDGSHSVVELNHDFSPQWVEWLLTVLDSHGYLKDGPAQSQQLNVRVHGDSALARRVATLLAASSRTTTVKDYEHSFDPTALHVVAASTVEVDRVLTDELQKQRCAHLIVRADETTATVGPFVIPGMTSCVTCADLSRRDMDPTWPVQAFQLGQVETHPGPWLCSWAAATAVAHALVYGRGLIPESASTTLEISAWDGRVTYRGWPVHPQCPWH